MIVVDVCVLFLGEGEWFFVVQFCCYYELKVCECMIFDFGFDVVFVDECIYYSFFCFVMEFVLRGVIEMIVEWCVQFMFVDGERFVGV